MSATKSPGIPRDVLQRLQRLDAHAVETFADYGPAYFNRFLGRDDAATFTNLSDGLQFLFVGVLEQDDLDEIRPGVKLLVQTMWAAAQYEAHRRGCGQ